MLDEGRHPRTPETLIGHVREISTSVTLWSTRAELVSIFEISMAKPEEIVGASGVVRVW